MFELFDAARRFQVIGEVFLFATGALLAEGVAHAVYALAFHHGRRSLLRRRSARKRTRWSSSNGTDARVISAHAHTDLKCWKVREEMSFAVRLAFFWSSQKFTSSPAVVVPPVVVS